MGSKKSWRPDGWKNPYEDIFTLRDAGNDEIALEKPCMEYKAFEAGADEMHKADVEWILEHILITEGIFSKNEWRKFAGEEAKE